MLSLPHAPRSWNSRSSARQNRLKDDPENEEEYQFATQVLSLVKQGLRDISGA